MKVAIVGTVPNSKRVTPCDDPSWTIWVCSPGNSQQGCPSRVDAWFELHSMVDMKSPENGAWFAPYMAWLNTQKFPVYMQERNEVVPCATPFPRNELLKKWGPKKLGVNWFTSSIAWMFAYALHLGAEEIGIFGVDMAANEEHYSGQKAGLLRFFEIANGLGVKVTIPLESTLSFGYPLYGYAESSRMGRALIIREQEIAQKIAQLSQQQHQISQEIAFFRGSQEQISFDRRTFVSGLDDAEVDFEDGVALLTPYQEVNREALASAAIDGSETAMDRFGPNSAGLLVPAESPPVLMVPMKAPSAEDFANDPAVAALLPKRRAKANGAQEQAE